MLAVIVKGYVPGGAEGVPLSVAVPFLLSTKLTPLGRVPEVTDRAGAGTPVVVTVKEPD